jgi:PAS domain S-box-containing protein
MAVPLPRNHVPPEPAPLRPRLRSTRAVALGVLLVDLLAIAAGWRSLTQSRGEKYEEAGRNALNLAHVLGENLEGTFHLLDLVLIETASEIGPGLERGAPVDHAREPHLAMVTARLRFVDAIRVADATGAVLYGAGTPAGGPVNVGDRDYFEQAKGATGDGLIISSPLVSRITGRRSVVFAHRLSGTGGRFLGVVYAVVAVDQLTRSLARVDLGPDGAVVLRDHENAVIARYPAGPDGDRIIGQKRVTPELAEILAKGWLETTFVAVSPIDHVEKVNAVRRLAGGAFYVLVAASTDAFLDGWRAEAWRTLLALAAFLALSVVAGLLVVRSWRRESEARFRALVDGAPMAVAVARAGRIVYANPAFVATFGVGSVEAAAGRSLVEAMAPEDAPRAAERFDRLARGLPVDPVAEFTLRRPGGAPFRAEITDAPVELEGGRAVIAFVQDVTERRRSEEERERLIGQLQRALADVKTLRGLLPICAHCKKVRDDHGYWSRIETFLRQHSEAEFTHGICPDCATKYFPDEMAEDEPGPKET